MLQEIVVQGSIGNVFADLGLDNSDKLLVKAELARRIASNINPLLLLWGERNRSSNISSGLL